MNKATQQKRTELSLYIEREVIPASSIQGVIVIGSVAKGTARINSDIDAIVFMEPFDPYIVPAECKWQPEQGAFYGIFSHVENSIQLDFHRLDLGQWSKPTHIWPKAICAALSEGWVAFDRHGQVQKLIAERTKFGDDVRQAQLDEALLKLDWLLSASTTARTWATLGAQTAHYRLHSAFDYLVQGLMAYHRRWRSLRSRELPDLLGLPWLPKRFEEQLLLATNALSETENGYRQRAAILRGYFEELVAKCQQDGLYGQNAVSEAFIRQHDEPGRNWNMDEWNRKHQERNS